MPEWFSIVSTILIASLTVVNLINGHRVMKNNSPLSVAKKELGEKLDGLAVRVENVEKALINVDNSELTRQKFHEIDAKLERDYRQITQLTEANGDQKAFLKILVKSQMLILGSINGTDKMDDKIKKMLKELEDFFIEQALN